MCKARTKSPLWRGGVRNLTLLAGSSQEHRIVESQLEVGCWGFAIFPVYSAAWGITDCRTHGLNISLYIHEVPLSTSAAWLRMAPHASYGVLCTHRQLSLSPQPTTTSSPINLTHLHLRKEPSVGVPPRTTGGLAFVFFPTTSETLWKPDTTP